MLLFVDRLSQKYGSKSIINNISFNLTQSSITALLGPNGAGKTTLLKTIAGILPSPKFDPKTKANGIFIKDQLINSWSTAKRVEAGLLYLPQHASLFSDLSVMDNLKIVYENHPYWRQSGLIKTKKSYKTFEEEVFHWLDKVNLKTSITKLAGELSGGQKRKLEIVRSLLMHPQILMLDEPFAGVDPKSIYELKEIFVDLKNNGYSILISDHHVDHLFSIADKIHVVISGEIVVSGGMRDILDNEYTKNIYLGGQFYEEISKKFLQ